MGSAYRLRRPVSRGNPRSRPRRAAKRDREAPGAARVTPSWSWRTGTTTDGRRAPTTTRRGTAALLELARAYATAGGPAPPPPPITRSCSSRPTAGASEPLGAARFSRSSRRWRDRVVAVVNLDAIAGSGAHAARDRRRAAPLALGRLVRTAASAIVEQSGREPGRARALGQLIDLAFPFSLYEQAPFVGRGTPALHDHDGGRRGRRAVRRHAGSARPPAAGRDRALGTDAPRLARRRRRARAGHRRATSTWAHARCGAGRSCSSCCAALLPCLAVIVDLFARLRRRRIALAPALRELSQPADLLALCRPALRALRPARRAGPRALRGRSRPRTRPEPTGRSSV